MEALHCHRSHLQQRKLLLRTISSPDSAPSTSPPPFLLTERHAARESPISFPLFHTRARDAVSDPLAEVPIGISFIFIRSFLSNFEKKNVRRSARVPSSEQSCPRHNTLFVIGRHQQISRHERPASSTRNLLQRSERSHFAPRSRCFSQHELRRRVSWAQHVSGCAGSRCSQDGKLLAAALW